MAKLSGGSWRTLQKEPVGTVTEGVVVSFDIDVPSQNPAFPAQCILTLDIDGENVKVPCPKMLAGVMKDNASKLSPGTMVSITYAGQKMGKKGGKAYHAFDVETVEEPGSNG